MTPQEFIYVFLLIPAIHLFKVFCDFFRVFLFVDCTTIKAICISKWSSKDEKPSIEPTDEVSSYVMYEDDGITYNKRKLKTQYDLFTVGEEVDIYIDLMGRPRQEINLDKEIVSLFTNMAIVVGEVLYFVSIIYPTVHWGM